MKAFGASISSLMSSTNPPDVAYPTPSFARSWLTVPPENSPSLLGFDDVVNGRVHPFKHGGQYVFPHGFIRGVILVRVDAYGPDLGISLLLAEFPGGLEKPRSRTPGGVKNDVRPAVEHHFCCFPGLLRAKETAYVGRPLGILGVLRTGRGRLFRHPCSC